jgi:hypothetical protein
VQRKNTQTLRMDPAVIWPVVAHSPLVWRFTAYMMLLGLLVLLHTWSRIDARETALALDRARVHAELYRTQNERLLLELATMTSLGSLQARATGLDLAGVATVVEVY